MKTALFFDVDGTLFDNEHQHIRPKTIELIKKLHQEQKYILGLATGRSLEQLDAIKEIRDLFEIKILINGAVAYHDDTFIYGKSMPKKDCEAVLKYANSIGVGIGFIGKDGHAVSLIDPKVRASLVDYQMSMPVVDPLFYLNHDVYQIWVFTDNKQVVSRFIEHFKHLKLFPWHKDGADIVHKAVSKGEAIKHIKTQLGIDKVIAFGDGENDVEMLEMANIGVAMGNTRSQHLKEKATFVTNPISEDGLYLAAIKLNII